MHAIQFKQPRALPGLYSSKFSEFVFTMLEKKIVKRPFVIELFERFFQSPRFQLPSEQDRRNLEFYLANQQKIEKKKMTDANTRIINREFNAMKNRIFPKDHSFLVNSYLNSVKTLRSNATDIKGRNHPVYASAKVKKNQQVATSLIVSDPRPISPAHPSPRHKYRLDTLF